MARTKSTGSRKHRKILEQAKGFSHARRKRVRVAKETLLHAGQYAYASRRLKKRDFRKLWIIRLNAAAREHGVKYSELIKKLKDNKVEIDRKLLSDIAVNDPEAFKSLMSELK